LAFEAVDLFGTLVPPWGRSPSHQLLQSASRSLGLPSEARFSVTLFANRVQTSFSAPDFIGQ
jgi:hypothetical protein